MKVTTIYKVYGCDTGGNQSLNAEFYSITDACRYAVATKGKIDYGLPAVRKYVYVYNPTTNDVMVDYEKLSEDSIYMIAAEAEEDK